MTDYDKIEQVKALIVDCIAHMGVSAKVEYEDSIIKGLVFNISSYESRILIGHQGATLHALEIIVRALVARRFPGEQFFFTLDVDDYRRKREWYLKEAATAAVAQLKRTGRPFSFEPMPNYERRLIHSYLQENHPEVISASEGQDPRRHIIIQLKNHPE